jgi:hypothetical protein
MTESRELERVVHLSQLLPINHIFFAKNLLVCTGSSRKTAKLIVLFIRRSPAILVVFAQSESGADHVRLPRPL